MKLGKLSNVVNVFADNVLAPLFLLAYYHPAPGVLSTDRTMAITILLNVGKAVIYLVIAVFTLAFCLLFGVLPFVLAWGMATKGWIESP